MVSLISTSKQQSTYPQSRLSLVSASVSENNMIKNQRSTLFSGTSAHTNQSNHVSGLSVLNSDNHKRPLRIERIDPNTKSIRWTSSLSDETENLTMCNNDFIIKNKEDVAKKKEIQKGKKQVMTKNQRRKNNQNNLEDKLLSLKITDLERQQSILQQAIKRERYKLLDQFMNLKASNISYMKKSVNDDYNEGGIDLTSLKNNMPRYEIQHDMETERGDENYSKTSRSHKSHSSFSTQDLMRYANFINQPPPMAKPNDFSKIDERFIDQKVKYFPSYLRKSKTFVATTDVDTALNRVKTRLSANATFCTKHKKHRLAQIKADLYNSTKDMFGMNNEPIDLDKQMADAEAAAAAQMAEANANADDIYEDHYSFGTLTPTSRQQMIEGKTPLPAITPSNKSRSDTEN